MDTSTISNGSAQLSPWETPEHLHRKKDTNQSTLSAYRQQRSSNNIGFIGIMCMVLSIAILVTTGLALIVLSGSVICLSTLWCLVTIGGAIAFLGIGLVLAQQVSLKKMEAAVTLLSEQDLLEAHQAGLHYHLPNRSSSPTLYSWIWSAAYMHPTPPELTTD